MDPNVPPVEENRKFYTRFLKFKEDNPVKFFAILFIVLFLGAGLVGVVSLTRDNKNGSSQTPQNQKSSQFTPISNHALVYGFWQDNSSKIAAFNMSTGITYELASLPFDIKKVTVTSPHQLMFINKVDERDHGKEIASYDTFTKAITSFISAAPDFGIDDYQISPNKRYLATWEISVATGSPVLIGGKSRVYTVNLANPSKKNLIYDEVFQANAPVVHYPLAILDDGRVFLDRFQANAGKGWARGMSVSNFEGTEKSDVLSMQKGTFGTQPKLSPDGSEFVFAGFDSGAEGNTNSYKAIEAVNTLELLNATTLSRKTLAEKIPVSNIEWDPAGSDIFYSTVTELYNYNLQTGRSDLIDDSEEKFKNPTVISRLASEKLLVAQQSLDSSTVGNLGSRYASSVSEFGIYVPKTKKYHRINTQQGTFQYIALLPSSELDQTSLNRLDIQNTEKSLQLKSLAFKPDLAPKRTTQQSEPPEKDPNCNDPSCVCTNPSCDVPPDLSIQKCIPGDRSCMGSPLYLYGFSTLRVSVKVNTQIADPNVSYRDSFAGVLTGDGGITIEGKTVPSIKYRYKPAIDIVPPKYGNLVSREDLEKAVHGYGVKLGLNEKEINDLINDVSKEITTPYVFISFFDEDTSKLILPLSFNPQPDVYRNIVFYFKGLVAPVIVKAPAFEAFPARHGFTAVEISHIIDK